jgi:hypothetical protein
MLLSKVFMLLMLEDTVLVLVETVPEVVETDEMSVVTVVRLDDTVCMLVRAVAAVAASVTERAVRPPILVLMVEILLVRVVMLFEKAVEFVLRMPALFVSVVPVSAKVCRLVCILLGSYKRPPMTGSSMEYFFEGSEAVSIAGLKNGAVEGSPTATPVPPMDIERGSNESNGSASAAVLLNKSDASADSCK